MYELYFTCDQDVYYGAGDMNYIKEMLDKYLEHDYMYNNNEIKIKIKKRG